MDIYTVHICEKGADGAVHIFSERAFSNYQKALDYLKEEFFCDDYTKYKQYGEIVSHLNDDTEIISECFDAKGNQLYKRQLLPFVDKKVVYVTPEFKPQYALGDIVMVCDVLTQDKHVCVIGALPPSWEKLQWIPTDEENPPRGFEAAYMVEWISDKGCLAHAHVYEYEISPYREKLPEKLEFLKVLSRHHRKEEVIPEKKFLSIFCGEVYLLADKTFRDLGICLSKDQDNVSTAEMYSVNQVAVYEKGAGLILWDIPSGKKLLLDSLKKFKYEDNVKIYCHAPYICVVEDFGTNGSVINVDSGEVHNIIRGDYHVESCSYPIGFADYNGEAVIIHATDWNRLDITRLSDFTLLTPRELSGDNTVDYFYSGLVISPDGKHFAVDGWVWHPMEFIEVYNLDRFFLEYDKAFIMLEQPDSMSGYNWGRPLCWVDENIIAVGHNVNEGASGNDPKPSSILLYDVSKTKEQHSQVVRLDGEIESERRWLSHQLVDSITFDGFSMQDDEYFEVYGDLYYDKTTDCFIGINNETGLLIAARDGTVKLSYPEFKEWRYSQGLRTFFLFTTNPYKLITKSLEDLLKEKGI